MKKISVFLAALAAVLSFVATPAVASPALERVHNVTYPLVATPTVNVLDQVQLALPTWSDDSDKADVAVRTLAYLQGRARAAGIAHSNLRYIVLDPGTMAECGDVLIGDLYPFEYCYPSDIMVIAPDMLAHTTDRADAALRAVWHYAYALNSRHMYDADCLIGVLIRAMQNDGVLSFERATDQVVRYDGYRDHSGAAVRGWYNLSCPKTNSVG